MKITKNIRDPIHGDIPFTATEMRLMDTIPMQRLRGIRQLGASYLVFPGALHSRFEHSLGTCFMAKKLMEHLEKFSDVRITEKDKESISAAALLHDITHIPFGHTLEDERRIFPRHDSDNRRYNHFIISSEIGNILKESGLFDKVVSLLNPHYTPEELPAYQKQIVSHTICADLLDYLRRDARFCGLNMDYDDRLFRYFQVENDRLILNLQKGGLFRHDAFSEVIHLLRIRYFLTERVYYHHAKIAAGAMLSRAVERAVDLGFEQDRLFSLRDDSLLYLLEHEYGNDRALIRLIYCFNRRCLYKRCYVLTDHYLDIETRKSLSQRFHLNQKDERSKAEKYIARSVKIPQESVIVYSPPPSMNLKEADVLVKVDQESARPLCEWKSREVTSLQEKFGKLWKFYVFVDPEYQIRFARISEICNALFGMPNELPMIQKGQLSLF